MLAFTYSVLNLLVSVQVTALFIFTGVGKCIDSDSVFDLAFVIGVGEICVAFLNFIFWGAKCWRIFLALVFTLFLCFHAMLGISGNCNCSGVFQFSEYWITSLTAISLAGVYLCEMRLPSQILFWHRFAFFFSLIAASMFTYYDISLRRAASSACDQVDTNLKAVLRNSSAFDSSSPSTVYMHGNFFCENCVRSMQKRLLISSMINEDVHLLVCDPEQLISAKRKLGENLKTTIVDGVKPNSGLCNELFFVYVGNQQIYSMERVSNDH